MLEDECDGIKESTCGMGLSYVALVHTLNVYPDFKYSCPEGLHWATVEQVFIFFFIIFFEIVFTYYFSSASFVSQDIDQY